MLHKKSYVGAQVSEWDYNIQLYLDDSVTTSSILHVDALLCIKGGPKT